MMLSTKFSGLSVSGAIDCSIFISPLLFNSSPLADSNLCDRLCLGEGDRFELDDLVDTILFGDRVLLLADVGLGMGEAVELLDVERGLGDVVVANEGLVPVGGPLLLI